MIRRGERYPATELGAEGFSGDWREDEAGLSEEFLE